MTEDLILNQAQALAVYCAMRALRDASGRAQATFGEISKRSVHAFEKEDGSVRVVRVRRRTVILAEDYADQAAFATAYSLQTGA